APPGAELRASPEALRLLGMLDDQLLLRAPGLVCPPQVLARVDVVVLVANGGRVEHDTEAFLEEAVAEVDVLAPVEPVAREGRVEAPEALEGRARDRALTRHQVFPPDLRPRRGQPLSA